MEENRLSNVQDLMEEIVKIHGENAKEVEAVNRVEEIINKSNQLIEKSESTNKVMLDAKILQTGSAVVRRNVAALETNFAPFDEKQYVRGILSYLEDNSDVLIPEKAWSCFGPLTYHLFRKSQSPAFMIGTLSFGPPIQTNRANLERSGRVAGSKTTLHQAAEFSDMDTETKEKNIYEFILNALVKCYNKNEKKPVNFLEFIVNPHDYWCTVENIFYFSFLVRDGRVNMFVDDEGTPVIEPAEKSGKSESQPRKITRQFIFGLNKEQWRKCIEKLNITSPKIQPNEGGFYRAF